MFIDTVHQKNAALNPDLTKERTWIELNADALQHNITQYQKAVGPQVLVTPVIKGNAYGHGMLQIAQLIQNISRISYLCVVSLSEALNLRAAGIKNPLLVLSIVDKDPQKAALFDIDLVCHDEAQLSTFIKCARAAGTPLKLHLKIDTGLSRLGTLWGQASSFLHTAATSPECIVHGVFSHFSNSESDDLSFAQLQTQRLKEVVEYADIHIPFRHISCSASATALDHAVCNMVRVGIGTYGLWPSLENKTLTLQRHASFSLRPVLTWNTRIMQIKTLPIGSSIGYDKTFTTKRPTRIAILPIGYFDGYDRLLSNKGVVKIGDHFAPVVGRVAMNMTTIDVTDIPDAKENQTVTLLGKEASISAESIATHCNTINYEITTRIHPHIPRIEK